jgi:5'-3' exonuclease
MGIKHLHKFLQKHAPDVYMANQPLSAFSGKRIAIDTFLYLFQYKRQSRNKWAPSFVQLLLKMRRHHIECVLVYDTKTPLLKQPAVAERRERRRQLESALAAAEQAKAEYVAHPDAPPPPLLLTIMARHAPKLLLRMSSSAPAFVDMRVIDAEIARIDKQIVRITPEDVELTKALATAMGIPVICAPYEAETTASHLCCHGLVDAVLSDDTDVLVYGTPRFLTNLHGDTVTEIRASSVLESLEMTLSQFRDFCIMCGTDYNKNIFRIGCEKSFRLMKKHGSLEGIAGEGGIDIGILQHEEVRALFLVPETLEIEASAVVQQPLQFDALSRLLAIHHCSSAVITELLVLEKFRDNAQEVSEETKENSTIA